MNQNLDPSMDQGDEEIARIREIRHRISERFGHDPYRKDLLESAWERKLPEDLVAYGQALMARGNAWAAAHGCEEIREQDAGPEEEKSPEALAHIVFAAARWCIYWGERGHWLDVWF